MNLMKVIKLLRKNGKKIFLTSDMHVEYMDVVMTAAYGSDWINYFDFIASNCPKPLFYRAESPFYGISLMKKNLRLHEKVKTVEELT